METECAALNIERPRCVGFVQNPFFGETVCVLPLLTFPESSDLVCSAHSALVSFVQHDNKEANILRCFQICIGRRKAGKTILHSCVRCSMAPRILRTVKCHVMAKTEWNNLGIKLLVLRWLFVRVVHV